MSGRSRSACSISAIPSSKRPASSSGAAAKIVLPRRDLEGVLGVAADREHERVLLLGHRDALQRRVADEDDRSRRCVLGFAADREGGAAAHDDVCLLVPAGAAGRLVVLLDHVTADLFGGVGVDPERANAEPPAHGMPDDARDRDRVQLVEMNRLPARLIGSAAPRARPGRSGRSPRRAPRGSRFPPSARRPTRARRRSRAARGARAARRRARCRPAAIPRAA